MKKVILLLSLALLLTSCVAKVDVEEKPEEKIEVVEETPEKTEEEKTEPEKEAPAEDPVITPEETDVPNEIIPEENEIIPDDNEVPSVIVPDENELEALPTDFSNITEDELESLLEGFLSEGTVVELPIIPIE